MQPPQSARSRLHERWMISHSPLYGNLRYQRSPLCYLRSAMVHMPSPPPPQMVSRPYFTCLLTISCTRVTNLMTPVAPIGWPREIPEPFPFTLVSRSFLFRPFSF